MPAISIPVRGSISEKPERNKYWDECWEKYLSRLESASTENGNRGSAFVTIVLDDLVPESQMTGKGWILAVIADEDDNEAKLAAWYIMMDILQYLKARA